MNQIQATDWEPYQNIDFSDEQYNWYNIDTRDFHCVSVRIPLEKELKLPPNYKKNAHKYFHAPYEVKELLDRYYNESGGEGEWRMFSLEHSGENISGWDLKYIMIVRYKSRLLVCKRMVNGEIYPIKKSVLAHPVGRLQVGRCSRIDN